MRILLAIDDTAGSQRALDRLSELTPGGNREVIVLHVYQPLALEAALAGQVGYVPGVDETAVTHAKRVLVRACDRLERQGIGARAIRKIGTPAETILEVAQDEHVDLLVIGTHHMPAIARLLLGSVTGSLAAHTPVPLLIVP